MKTIKLTILLLLSPFTFFAQTLTGLWMGTVSNDSTTIRKDDSFEFVLTQYKNKVYGYSRSTFIVNDTLFYIVKRVKGTIEGDVCEVKDDEIVSHNFPGRVDKGVKMISTFRFSQEDSTWHLDGDWKTNKTKKYYSISGKIELKSEPNLEQSKIFPHLEELKLAEDVAFYKESKKQQQAVAVTKLPVKETKKEIFVKENKPVTQSKKEDIAKTKVTPPPTGTTEKPQTRKELMAKKEDVASVSTKPGTVAEIKQPVKDVPKDNPPTASITENKKVEEKIPAKEEPQKAIAVISKPVEQKKETVIISIPVETKKPETIITAPVAALKIKERKIVAPQVVNYKSDSLELSLYDNGEIDGDTVSVFFNGELILAKQGLKASALKKTIYIPAGNEDSTMLVLYAENLGKYPPNTGLLIVRDGEDTYQIRFSADLQQNAAVIFKRKRN